MAKRKSTTRSTRKSLPSDFEILNAFEIGIGRAALEGDVQNLDALEILGHALTRSGDHAEALKIDRRIVVLQPRNPVSHYNLACTYSHLKELDRSLQSLERAIMLGYRDIPHMLKDKDLQNVRRDPRFRKLVEKRWGKRQSRRK